MTSAPCAFCKIVTGRAPARMVAEYACVVAFLPVRPATAGHTLVVPRRHVRGLADLDAATGRELSDAVLDVAARIEAALAPAGLNVLQSSGRAATQSVFHLHVHVIPRTIGDRLPSPWPPPQTWDDVALDRVAAQLRDVRYPHST